MVIKLRSLALALVFFCLTVNNSWGQYAGTGTFTKATSLAALTDGYYIVGYESSATAGRLMTNTNAGTFFADAVTAPSSGVLTNPAAANVWLIRTDGGGRTIYNEASGTYVSYTGSSNAAQAVTSVTANNQRWTFAYGTLFTATNLAVTSRLLKSNSAATRFACYTTGQNDLTLYKLPTVTTIAQLTNGIAASPLTAGTTNKAILGFSASATGVPTLTAFNIGTSSTSVNKFTNFKLYVSTDNDYGTAGDNTQVTATITQTATQIQVSAISQALGFTAKYYFIVADVDASVTGSTAAVQPSLVNTDVTTSIGTVAAATLTGTSYSFAASGGATITETDASFGPFCNSGANAVSLSYTASSSPSPTTPLIIQLSNSSGSFASGTTNLTTTAGSGSVSASIPASQAAGTYRIRIISSDATPIASGDNGSDITVNAAVAPAVSINSVSSVCSNQSVTFTPTPSNLGGGTASYSWTVNGTPGVATTATYTKSTWASGNSVQAVMTVAGGCVTTTSASSSTVTPTVTTAVTPSVNIGVTAGNNPSCAGVSVTFTATPANLGGGSVSTYAWSPSGSGSTFTSTSLANNDQVSCSITVTGGCVTSTTASSAATTMVITSAPAAPVANSNTTPQVTNVNPTNFTANWSTVAGVTGYQLDVYQGAPAVTYASDDFEGTLSGWSSTTDWAASTTTPIAGSQSLKHNLSGVAGESYIYDTPTSYDVTTGTTVWQVTMKNGAFAPSTTNKFWFFLMSSSLNLTATSDVANGYAVGVNMTTTNSGTICLSKIVAGSGNPNVDLIASGVTWGSSGTYSIRVTRTAAGVWSLETKSGGGYTGMTAASSTATDATYTTSTYSGLDFSYTSTRAGLLWLDDYSITRPASTVFVSGYENLAVASGTTTTVVTPLSQGTDYTYVVRAVNSCGTSANSNAVDVLTGTTGFNITASAGANGSISPNGTTNVPSGGSQAYTITAAPCYNVASLTIDGVSQAGATSYTFSNVTANHSITAAFALNTYTVTASVSGGNGSITATASHNCGTSPVYSFTPNSGYAVSDVLVNGVSQGAISSYTFTNIAANHTIVVSFVAVTYSITTGTVSTFVCPGATFAVPYTTNLPASTAVAVQLSNSSGSFASPTQIGTGTTPTTITATMPTTASGLGYKVRVVAASPSVTGTQSSTIASQFSLAAPIFSEGMGSSAYATIGLCESAGGFDNDVYTMSGAAEIRITTVSGGYQEASAGGNVYLANSGVSTFRIDGINTNGSNPLTLNFGIQKSVTTDNASGLIVEYSINSGSSWTPINWGTLPTGTGTTGWYLIKLPGVIPQSTTLSLQFRNTTTANNIRLDDIGIYTGTASTASVSPSSPAAQCGGTVALQASPANAGYLWTGGTAASSLAVTTTGNYSVTITDRFGCAATAGPVAVTINTPATASVVISNTNTTVCTDVAQTFTATPTNGGTPTYLWYKNGISTGLTGNTYSPVANSLSNGDVISVSMTSTACVTTATVSSNTLTAQKFAYAPLTQEWIENFGTTAQTDVADYTSAANTSFTFTTGGTPLPDIRTSTVSPGGGANAYMGASGFATRYFTIGGINTSNAFPNRLSFYVYNPSTSSVLDNNSFWLEYSTDGTNFSSISYSAVPAGQAWSTVSINNALPKAATVWLRFNSDLQGAVNIRIDDIKLEKYTVGDIAVTPANPITLCSATQVLTSSANPTGSGYTTLWSTSATTAAITVSSAGTYNVTLTDAFGCKSSASRTVSAGSGVKTWNGTNHNWNDPVNWSCGTVPTSADNVVIPTTSNDPIISVTPAGICKNLTIDASVSLTINANQYLNVYGNVVNNGAAAFGDGTLSFEGGTAATVAGTITVSNVDIDKSVTVNSGAALNIITSLDLQSGMLTNNGTITLKSTSTGTAYLDNFSSTYSGDYSGNLTVERYVASSGTHYIGYPFTSYALTSTGVAGAVVPQPSCNANATATNSPYSNIYKWEEATTFTSNCSQQGWVAVTGENSVTGKGYAVTLGSNQTLSLTGAPIIDDYNYGASKSTYTVPNPTPSAGVFNPLYTQVTGGTNLVSNPFPSPYEWDGGNSSIEDIAYVWQTIGTYKGTYQPVTVGTVLATGQGFFVKATAGTNLSFVNSKRRTATNPTFYQTNNGANLDITMAGNGFADRTQIVFNDQATLGFDGTFDGFKMLSNYSQPTLYTVITGNTIASINTLPSIDQSPNVVMGMFVGTSGNYEFTFNNINSFDPTSYVYLEDTKTGTMQDMRASNTYSFAATTSDAADRFVVHFTPAAEINTVDATCSNSGTISITQPGTATWTYTVTDNNNATISSGSLNQNSAATVNAVAGTYTLTLTDANNYIVMKTVTVNGSTPIAASFTPSATTVEETNDVTFNSTTSNAVTTAWDFGDGATASTATATHAYATPGTYTVTLTVTNATGCSSTTTQVITVTAKTTTGLNNVTANKALNIWSNDNRVFIDFSKQLNVEATIEFYNVLGQQLMQEKFGRSTIFIKELSNIEAAYVIVKVKNNDTITTKKVFIMNK